MPRHATGTALFAFGLLLLAVVASLPPAHAGETGPLSLPTTKMALQQFANKKYKLDSSENFDDFMKAVGVSFVTRQVGNAVSPVVHMTIEGDKYTLVSTSSFKTHSITFKLGEPFDQDTPDGRKVKATITLEGENTLVENQEGGGKTTKIVREFSPNEIKMVLTVDNIVCTRIYKLQE